MAEQNLDPPSVMISDRSSLKSLARFRPKLIAGALAVLCVVVLALTLNPFHLLKVRGASMTPGIGEGDNVLVLTPPADLSRGSIIVYLSPDADPPMVLRRIVALPGDVIEIRKGRVFINEAAIEEPYVSAQQNLRQREMAPIRVLDHSYFVLADNRDGAYDSRDWGVVPNQQIYGRVLLQY